MENEKRLIYVEDVIALFEKDIADSREALKTAWPGDKDEIRAEMNGVRAALHILKHHASHGGTVDAVEVVHGWWEDVKETSLYVPDMKYTVTHTAETCSACNVRIGFIGSKPYLYDHICPNCGAKMDGEMKDKV